MLKRIVLLITIGSTLCLKATQSKEENGFSGNFDLGLNFTKNTESTLQLNNLFLIKYKTGKSNLILENNIALINRTGEDELLNKGTQDFKYALNAKELDANITFQHLYDISRSIRNRYTSGIGISYTCIDQESKKIGIGLSALREKEIPIEGKNRLQNRISSSSNIIININKNITIDLNNYYQPNIEKIGDFRWNSKILFKINISPHFFLNVNANFNYDSMPATGISEIDYQLINSISYKF